MGCWKRALVLLTVIAAATLLGPAAAAADDPVAGWTPVGVLPGQWGPPVHWNVDPLVLSTTQCVGKTRSWADEEAALTVAVTWHECGRNLDVAAAELDDRHQASPARWRSRGDVLGEGLDIIEPRVRAHQRSWVEDRFQVTVYVQCLFDGESRCLELSRKAVQDISRRIPGEPTKIVGSRSMIAMTWLLSVMLVWLFVLGAVAAVRRLANAGGSYATHPDGARWTNVDEGAKRLRRHMRLRRYGTVLVAPTAGAILIVVGRAITGSLNIATLSLVPILAIFGGLAGVVMLVASRSPVRGDEWRWQVHRLDLPRTRRIVSAVISAGSTILLVLLVSLFPVAVGAGRVAALPPLLHAGLQMIFFSMLAAAVPVSWLVRRRATADAWRSLNSRSGPPIVFLRDAASQAADLRASVLTGRGALNYVGSLLKPQRRLRFDEALANLLVRQGPVLVLQAPSAATDKRGPRSLDVRDVQADEVAREVMHSQAMVLVAGPPVMEPHTLGLTRFLIGLAREKPLLVVLPPISKKKLQQRWAQWYRVLADVAPVTDLDPALVADGAHVLVHLPGHGWHAWGARRRDEWTYTQAAHDALAFSAASVAAARHAAEQVSSEAETNEAPTRDDLEVVAVAADERTAADIAAGLSGMGRPAVVRLVPSETAGGDTPSITNVVVISEAALANPQWHAAVEDLIERGNRPVPVVLGTVHAGSVPEGLQEINWVLWAGEQRVGALAALFAAISSEPSRYQLHRDLLSRARSWVSDNRSQGLLLADHDETEQAAAHLADATHDPLARPSALLHDFVTASVVRARQYRRRNRRLLITGVVLAVATVLLFSGIWFAVRGPAENQRLNALVSIGPRLASDRPDWAGLLAGALIVQGDAEQAETGRLVLRSMLDRVWPRTRVGVAHDALVNDMAMVGDSSVLTVDNRGTLTRWDLGTGAVQWRRHLEQPLNHLAATPDGATVVAASARHLHLIKSEPWEHRRISFKNTISRVAVAADGTTAVVADEDGRLITIGTGPAETTREVGRYRNVLDLQAGAADSSRTPPVWALVRTSASQVAVVEALAGRQSRPLRVSLRDAMEVYGGVAADGTTLAVASGGGDLQTGTVDAGLRPGGGRVPALLDGLAVFPAGGVITTGRAFGVQVMHPPSGAVVGRLQVAQHGVIRIRSSPDGRFLLCADHAGVAVWDTQGLWPTDAAGEVVDAGRSSRAGRGQVALEGADSGAVSIRVADRSVFRQRVLSGSVTAAAVRGDESTALVGSDRGEIAEIDIDAGVVVRRWASPLGGRVETVGWSSDGRIVVGSATGSWWSVESCGGCGTDEALLTALRARLWGCYSTDNVQGITDAARQRLNLRVCAPSPRAKED